MPRKRKNETDEQRAKRLKNAHERQDADDREDGALDAMVRKSIDLHGA